MQKVDLTKVLEALLEENHDEATGLVHEWIVQLSGQVHESLMAEDEAGDDIASDQKDIEAEEFYGEDEEGGEEAAPEAGAEEAPAEVPADEKVEVSVSDLEQMMANLHAEFAAIMNGEALPGAEEAGPADMGDDLAADVGADAHADELAIEEPAVEAINVAEAEEADEAEEVEEAVEEDAEEAVVEADEFADLDEAFEDLEESTLPTSSPDAEDAEPVKIKAKQHKGFEREAAPGTKKPATPKAEPGNARKDGKSVSKDGDKSAMLNKKTGFGSDSPKSPLSGLKGK
jgi:hypothetical protein